MEHSYFQDRLSAYHDNELPLQEKVVVQEHVRECEECRELLAEYEKLDQLVASHGQLADGDYWEKSARKIDRAIAGAQATETEDITPQKRSSLVWKLLPIAASIVIVGYIGLHRDEIFQPGPGKANQAPEVPAKAESIPARPRSDGLTQKSYETPSVPVEKDKQSVSKQLSSVPPSSESARPQEVQTKTHDEPAPKTAPSGAEVGQIARKTDQPIEIVPTDNMVMAQKAAAAPSVVSREDADYKKAEDELAANTATPMPAAADTGLGLKHWIGVRDSLLAVVNTGSKGKTVQSLTDKLSSAYTRGGRTPGSLLATDPKAIAAQSLAEASFWVAKLSSEDSVRTNAIATLRDLAAKSSAAEQAKIQSYLQELGAAK